MSTSILVTQTIRKWGNGLAIRINTKLAKAALLSAGVPVVVEARDGLLVVRLARSPRLTLAKTLEQFDPAIHGGEAMAATRRVGAERF